MLRRGHADVREQERGLEVLEHLLGELLAREEPREGPRQPLSRESERCLEAVLPRATFRLRWRFTRSDRALGGGSWRGNGVRSQGPNLGLFKRDGFVDARRRCL